MKIQALATHPVTFVTARELANYWLVHPRQIYRHIGSGLLPAIRVGKWRYRIPTKAAAEFERSLLVRPMAKPAARRQSFPNLALIRGRDGGCDDVGRLEPAGAARESSPCVLVAPAEGPADADVDVAGDGAGE